MTGYYDKPPADMLSASGTKYSGSSRMIGATLIGTGVYAMGR